MQQLFYLYFCFCELYWPTVNSIHRLMGKALNDVCVVVVPCIVDILYVVEASTTGMTNSWPTLPILSDVMHEFGQHVDDCYKKNILNGTCTARINIFERSTSCLDQRKWMHNLLLSHLKAYCYPPSMSPWPSRLSKESLSEVVEWVWFRLDKELFINPRSCCLSCLPNIASGFWQGSGITSYIWPLLVTL